MTNMRVTLSLLVVILAFAKSAPGQSNWSVFTSQPHGFSIELPGTPQEEPGKPGQFIVQSGSFTFIAMPGDFVARPVGQLEGGCLWGTKDDLDRVTVDPSQGDFTALRRGVFRARVTSEVACRPMTGVFDQLDGTGEEGIGRALVATGAKVVVFKKETIAGLPALQIVGDIPGSRVYMLYLGNTKFISNAMLVNYYHPTNRSDADDALWAQFVAGIKASK